MRRCDHPQQAGWRGARCLRDQPLQLWKDAAKRNPRIHVQRDRDSGGRDGIGLSDLGMVAMAASVTSIFINSLWSRERGNKVIELCSPSEAKWGKL
jgi:hypothetical protein